jgi:hypothetical protein
MANKRINYFRQLQLFRVFEATIKIKHGSRLLYYYLMQENNIKSWAEFFYIDPQDICEDMQINKNTYYASLQELTNNKLVKVEKGIRGRLFPKISLSILNFKVEFEEGILYIMENENKIIAKIKTKNKFCIIKN